MPYPNISFLIKKKSGNKLNLTNFLDPRSPLEVCNVLNPPIYCLPFFSLLLSSFLGFVLFSKVSSASGGRLGCCVNLGKLSGQIDYHRCRAIIAFKSVVSYHDTAFKSLFFCHCILLVSSKVIF